MGNTQDEAAPGLGFQRPATLPEPAPAALDAIESAALRRAVECYAVPRHALRNARANRRVARELAAELNGMGYRVEFYGACRTLLARHPAAGSGPVLLVGAHYDSVPDCPGADDNASALAALLGCAAVVARSAPDAPVAFACFNREEDGLLGSAEFARRGLAATGLQLRAVHVLEMVGYRSTEPASQHTPAGLPLALPDRADFLGLVANSRSGFALREVLDCAGRWASDLPVIGLELVAGFEELMPTVTRSDHASFWRVGVPALMWTDTAEFRNPHYHQLSDRPDTLDYEFLRAVTRLLAGVCLAAARGGSLAPPDRPC